MAMAQSNSGIIEGGDSLREVSNDGRVLKLLKLVTLRSSGKTKGKQGTTPQSSSPSSSKTKGKQATTPQSSPSSSSVQHYSARTDRLIQMRSEISSDLEFEIESSKEHWSELSSVSVEEAEETVDWMIQEEYWYLLNWDSDQNKKRQEWVNLLSNRSTKNGTTHLDSLLFEDLKWRYRYFFRADACWKVGRKIAEGAQAYIYAARYDDPDDRSDQALHKHNRYVFKIFKEGVSVLDILKMLEKKVITGYCTTYTCPVWSVHFFRSFKGDSGRFAFRMQKYWGDLRRLMDLRMRETSNRNSPPLSHYEALRSMEFVAKGMRDLHSVGILHRDLKASNVFVEFTYKPGREHYICSSECKHVDLYNDAFDCRVGDFECSRGVVGTGFWRAPEILLGLKNRNVTPDLFTQKSDVYSYGMTCYEILTGKFPLEDVGRGDYDFVLEGGRPEIPEFVDLWICEMLKSCWQSDPSRRPSFQDLCETLEHHIHNESGFNYLSLVNWLWN